ncbi:MAG: hypothetical protein IT249_09915 [Chitinophagaceae bacterium]|nr:hypothetical protein [Chitinophagaceae bacterium]
MQKAIFTYRYFKYLFRFEYCEPDIHYSVFHVSDDNKYYPPYRMEKNKAGNWVFVPNSDHEQIPDSVLTLENSFSERIKEEESK